MNKSTQIDYYALPHQLEVLKSDKKITAMFGGIASGKTDIGSLWTVQKVVDSPEGVLGLIAANTYTQLKDSTIRNLYKNFRNWGLVVKPRELPEAYGPFNIRVWKGKHSIEILCRSLDHYETLSGLELGWAWIDEAWGSCKEAFDIVMGRARDKRAENKILLTTVLDEPSISWMYDFFITHYDEKIMQVTYATTYDNERNLPAGFIDSLKRAYTEKMFKRMVMAKWIAAEEEAIYYNFDRNIHVTENAEFDPFLPILWTHDFNIGQGKPMSSCLAQIKKGRGGEDNLVRPELHFFDEIILQSSDTNDAITEFKNRPWIQKKNRYEEIVIYGDASGQARDTRSKATDYVLLKEAGFWNQEVPLANPPIRERHNAVNALLKNVEGDIRLFIHPRCKTLIRGFETVSFKKGAGYIEQESFAQHVTTAAGYLINKEFPIQKHTLEVVSLGGF